MKLAQREFLLLFKEFAEVHRLGDFIICNLRGRMAIQNVSVIVTVHRTCEPKPRMGFICIAPRSGRRYDAGYVGLFRPAHDNPFGVRGLVYPIAPCSGRRASARNMGLLKWNPSGVRAPPLNKVPPLYNL